jgi:hypothetical protein
MKKLITDTGTSITVRARPDDAVARIRKLRASLRERIGRTQPTPLLTDAERDLLLLAIAQTLDIA